MCVGEGDNEPAKLALDIEISIWENKNNKAYAFIATSVNEDAIRHISPFSNAFEALQKLKELYDSHSELEVVQLMIKLFSYELKNHDPLALVSELRSIMNDIKTIGVQWFLYHS